MILKEYIKRRRPLGRGIQKADCNFAFGAIPSWLICSTTPTFSSNAIAVGGSSAFIKTTGVVLDKMDLLSVTFENLVLTNDLCTCSIVFENSDGSVSFGIYTSPNENKTYFKVFVNGTEMMSKVVGVYENNTYWYLGYGKNATSSYSFAPHPRNIGISYSPSYDLFVVEDDGYDVFQTNGIAELVDFSGSWSVVLRNNYTIKTSNVVFELQQSIS